MYNRKNHIIPSFFILLLLLPLLMIMILQGWQWYIKIAAEHRLEHSLLQTITLPAERLIWEEQGKEAIVEGKLFDVKHWHNVGNKVVLTGLFDEQETTIVKMLQREAGHSKSNYSLIRLFLFLQSFAAIVAISPISLFFSKILSVFAFFHKHYSNPFQIILSPPPRSLFPFPTSHN